MDFASKKILVVGGSGFIGGHLVHKLQQCDAEITVVGHKDRAINKLNYIQADLANKQTLLLLKKIQYDYVFNLGGYIDHTPYFNGGRKVIEQHYIGLLNLLDSLDRTNLKGFVQIGSSDEYGNNPSPQSEDMREQPISPYSLAKVSASHLIQTLANTENFPGTVLRLFLVYGPGQDDKRFLPKMIKGCLNDQTFPTSEGKQLRDFCYVDDVVDAMLLAATHKNAHGEIINIASGIPISIHDVTEMVRGEIGSGNPQYGQFPYRKGENMSLYADISKAMKLLDWQPTTSFNEGLQKTIEHYKELVCMS